MLSPQPHQPQGGEGGQVTVLPVVAHKNVPYETDSVANSCTGGQGHNPSHTGNQNMGNQARAKTKTWATNPNLKKVAVAAAESIYSIVDHHKQCLLNT